MFADGKRCKCLSQEGARLLRLNLANEVLAGYNCLNRRNEVGCRGDFRDERVRTGRQGGICYSRGVVLTQEDYSCFWGDFTHVNGGLDPAESWHADVQHDHVGLK